MLKYWNFFLSNFGNRKIEKKEKEKPCSKHEKIGMCSYWPEFQQQIPTPEN